MGISREVWDLRDGTPPNKEKNKEKNKGKNKEKPFQTRKNLSKQGKTFPNKEKNKKKHHQTRNPPFKQEKHLSSKEPSFRQAGGIFHSNIEVYKW